MKLRDALWLFGVPAHENDSHVGAWRCRRSADDPNNFPRSGSSMTPAEAAFFLGIPNMIMISSDSIPTPFTEYADKYLHSFVPMDRVLWSSTGSGGYRDGREEDYVIARHEAYPNLCGCYLDDPLMQFHQYPEAQRTQLAKAFVSEIRRKMDSCSRPMDIVVTWYPHVAASDDSEVYEDVDGIAIYTWNATDLDKLDEVMSIAKAKFPGKQIYLGNYLFDFARLCPLSIEEMAYQCEKGKQWLLDGTIAGMTFVTNGVMAPGMQIDLWLRDWIRENGDIELPDSI